MNLLLAVSFLASSLSVMTTDSIPADNVRMDRFGNTLLMTETRVFVGEPAGFSNTGMVHVIARDERGEWNITHTIRASDAEVGDGFGMEMVLSGGFLVVSAPTAADGAGAVYIFREQMGMWSEVAVIPGPGGDRVAEFGSTMTASDGLLFIAAPGADARTGSVYVYQLEAPFGQVVVLTPQDRQEGDQFGSGLAVKDGRLLVGSPGHNQNRGRIDMYVIADNFRHTGGMHRDDAPEGDRLGVSLMAAGEYVFSANPRATRGAGQVHAFTLKGGSLDLAATLSPDGEGGSPRFFGASLAVSGAELIVAAPLDDGAGRLYRYDTRNLKPLGAIENPGTGPRSQFGSALAASTNRLVVGIPGDDYGLGSTMMFAREGTLWRRIDSQARPVPTMEPIAGEMIECQEGEAMGHACQNVDLVSFIPLEDLHMNRGVRLNDVWGWTDPETGREFGIIGHMEAAVLVDLTNPQQPVVLGEIPRTEGSPGSTWRDMKIYKDHVFIVADGAEQHGMQVFDMTRLRDWPGEYQYYEPDAHYTGIASSHNIVINEETGYAYTVGNSSGGETCGGGLHMINIRDPKNPMFVGCFNDPETGRNGSGATHDAQCVNYQGPDTEHHGKEICISSNGTAISVSDVTNKENPIAISQGRYPNSAYVHQGWFTDDQRFFYQNDEADEISGAVEKTRTMVWDMTDLDEPIMVAEYYGATNSTDHNLYVKGDFMYQTNNASGLRVVDIRDRTSPVEIGYFDTTPNNRNVAGFDGTWSSYPYFQSGNILVTSRREGLFVLRARQQDL